LRIRRSTARLSKKAEGQGTIKAVWPGRAKSRAPLAVQTTATRQAMASAAVFAQPARLSALTNMSASEKSQAIRSWGRSMWNS
jgi:hypothetical protein